MIGLTVEAGAARALAEGVPALVLAPGVALPPLPPLLALEWREGVLAPPGAAPARILPLPAGARLMALVADGAAAARIAPLLPGVKLVPSADPLPALVALLTEALREAEAGRDAGAEARRLLAHRAPPPPRLLLEIAPSATASATGRLRQPMGRPAEGVCTLGLHLARVEEAGHLRVRLLAGGRIGGAWFAPGRLLSAGWLFLDLPEPLRAGAAEAEFGIEAEGVTISAGEIGDAPLAFQAWVSAPGRHVMPRFCDWAALGAVPRGVPHQVALDGIAIGDGRAARLIRLEGEAVLELPPVPAGPAELIRLRLACREGEAAGIEAMLTLDAAHPVESGWRGIGAAITLPLPPAPVVARLALRNSGGPALVEIAELALLAGIGGEARRAPAPELPRASASVTVQLPTAQFRVAPPQPRMAVATAPAVSHAGGASWQEVRAQQHLVSPDGGYRHLEMVITGLVSGAGLWRQVRTKLFDRRGVLGLEFREAAGWPRMFDQWPGTGSDSYGPLWRLESEGMAAQLARVTAPHDRALVAALLDALPALAQRAAAAAALDAAEIDAWAARARRLAASR